MVGVAAVGLVAVSLFAGLSTASAGEADSGGTWANYHDWALPHFPGTDDPAVAMPLPAGEEIRAHLTPNCAGTFTYRVETDPTAMPVGVVSFTPDGGADCSDGGIEVKFDDLSGYTHGSVLNASTVTEIRVVGVSGILWASLQACGTDPAGEYGCGGTKFSTDPDTQNTRG